MEGEGNRGGEVRIGRLGMDERERRGMDRRER